MDSPQPEAKGPVEQIRFEEYRMLPGQTGTELTLSRSMTLRFDADQHEIERTDRGQKNRAFLRTYRTWTDGRLQSSTCERANVKNNPAQPVMLEPWDKYSYDATGKLTELQRGRGTDLINHYLNFQYDLKNRVTSWDYRQGKDDKPMTHTEIKYTGNTVEKAVGNSSGTVVALQIQGLDDAGRVIDLKISDMKKGVLTLWYHTTFKYDGKGRVIEQNTDPYNFGAGDDNSPMPGKYIAQYDDEKNTVEQKFFETNGKLGLRSIGQLDRDGLLVALQKFDGAGKVATGSDFVLNPTTNKMEIQKGSVFWEVIYDDHANWIERKRWFTPVDGGARILLRRVTQTITYRDTDKTTSMVKP